MPDPISWAHAWPYLAAAFAAGYLLGSVPFGMVLTRLAGLGDIRGIGSGNIGTTNVLRTGRRDLALATLLLDGGKGGVAVLILLYFWGPDSALMAGLGSVIGHLFPVWLRFKGGKGVATTLGVLLALHFLVGLAICLTWLAVALVFRMSSLAGLLSLAAGPLWAWWIAGDLQLAEMAAILAVLVWIRHHENILRILKGKEPRIGKGRKG